MALPDLTCSIPSCDNPPSKKGWCNAHYLRWRRHGDPLAGGQRYTTPAEALAHRTERRGGCLVWTGARNPQGYGEMRNGSAHPVPAYRVAWELVNGPIPAGMQIDHRCWNPACVEVAHLRLATSAENGSNLNGPRSDNRSTGVRNVYKNRGEHLYYVRVKKGGQVYGGSHRGLGDAIREAEELRAELFGEFAGRGERA